MQKSNLISSVSDWIALRQRLEAGQYSLQIDHDTDNLDCAAVTLIWMTHTESWVRTEIVRVLQNFESDEFRAWETKDETLSAKSVPSPSPRADSAASLTPRAFLQ